MAVTVITDSAASLPRELVANLPIVVVPMSVIVGSTPHPDGELSLQEVMAHVDDGVSTSGVTPGSVLEAIEQANDEVIILTVSRKMSSTFEAATTAAEMADRKARVIDTRTAAGGEGLVVLAAAEAAARGESIDDVTEAANHVIERVRLMASIENLDRLVASGRVPGVAGLASRWLGMQPLFEFSDGGARPLRPAFSRDAALDRIATACRGSAVSGGTLHLAGLHADARDDAELLVKKMTADFATATSFIGAFSSVMVAHTGLGLVGLAWWWEG